MTTVSALLFLSAANAGSASNAAAVNPGKFPRFSPEEMQNTIARLDSEKTGSAAHDEPAAKWCGYQMEGLRACYAMVNSQGMLYVGNKESVLAYGDAKPGDPASEMVKLGQ